MSGVQVCEKSSKKLIFSCVVLGLFGIVYRILKNYLWEGGAYVWVLTIYELEITQECVGYKLWIVGVKVYVDILDYQDWFFVLYLYIEIFCILGYMIQIQF